MFFNSLKSFLATFVTLGLDLLRAFPGRMIPLSIGAVLIGLIYPAPLVILAYTATLLLSEQTSVTFSLLGSTYTLQWSTMLAVGILGMVGVYLTRLAIGIGTLRVLDRWQPDLFKRLVNAASDADSLQAKRPRIGAPVKVLHGWAGRLAQAGTQIGLFFTYGLHSVAVLIVLTGILVAINWKFFGLFLISCVVMLPFYGMAFSSVRDTRTGISDKIKAAQIPLKAMVGDVYPHKDAFDYTVDEENFIGLRTVSAQHKRLLFVQLVAASHIGAVIAAFIALREFMQVGAGISLILVTVAFFYLRTGAGFVQFLSHLTRNYENIYLLRNNLYPAKKTASGDAFKLDIEDAQPIYLSPGDFVQVRGQVPSDPVQRQPIASALTPSNRGARYLRTWDENAMDHLKTTVGPQAFVISADDFEALPGELSSAHIWFVYGTFAKAWQAKAHIVRSTVGISSLETMKRPTIDIRASQTTETASASMASAPQTPVSTSDIRNAFPTREGAFLQSYPDSPIGLSHRSVMLGIMQVPEIDYPAVIRFRAATVAPKSEKALASHIPDALKNRPAGVCVATFYVFDAADLPDDLKMPPSGKAVHALKFRLDEEATDICLPLRESLPDQAAFFVYVDRQVRDSFYVETPQIISRSKTLTFDGVDRMGILTYTTQKTDLSKTWRQDGNRLIVTWLEREFWMDAPDGLNLSSIDPRKIEAANILLFDNCEYLVFGCQRAFVDPKFRAFSEEISNQSFAASNVLLAYSTGEDSTAALALLPRDITVPFHTKRAYRHYRTAAGHRIDLGERSLEEAALARVPDCVIVENTLETIGLSVGTTHGFRDNFGYGAVGLLLADHFGANTIAFGSVMEQVYLRSGNDFTDVYNYLPSRLNRYSELLRYAGVFFSAPTGFLSEVLTNKICQNVRDELIAVPCPKTDAAGQPCGTCFKCFRKTRLEGGTTLPPHEHVSNLLKKRPLKSATSVVIAAQRAGYDGGEFAEYMGEDLSHFERYFGTGLEQLVPHNLHAPLRETLASHGIEPMSDEDEIKVRNIAKTFSPATFDEKRAFPEPRQASTAH